MRRPIRERARSRTLRPPRCRRRCAGFVWIGPHPVVLSPHGLARHRRPLVPSSHATGNRVECCEPVVSLVTCHLLAPRAAGGRGRSARRGIAVVPQPDSTEGRPAHHTDGKARSTPVERHRLTIMTTHHTTRTVVASPQ